jgi:signal transduction histidine kinase
VLTARLITPIRALLGGKSRPDARPGGTEADSEHLPWLSGAGAYVLSAVTVAVALWLALRFEHVGLTRLEFPLFLFAIASTIWYPGIGPAVVSVLLSAVAFNYFFTEPRYTFRVAPADLPYYAAFLFFATMLTGFSVYRRRIEKSLVRSRQQLQAEVIERKAREEQVEKLNTQLEQRSVELEVSNGELEAFAYSVSHDLRAPLRHMAGFAELLGRHAGPALDEKSTRYLGIILESSKRMGTLIDDLLAFSRVGRTEAQETTVDLGRVVQEIVQEVRPDTAGREIQWRIGVLPPVRGDPSMLRIVFANLIGNALKFTRTRPRAEIEIGTVEDPGGVVVFVKDNGVGFDMRYANKLFRVFQRLHRSDDFEGTGIGLATVQRVIHRFGGTVRAEGVVDGGATFFVTFPPSVRMPPQRGEEASR